MRTPSYFSSKAQFLRENGSATRVASIGETRKGILLIERSFPAAPANLPQTMGLCARGNDVATEFPVATDLRRKGTAAPFPRARIAAANRHGSCCPGRQTCPEIPIEPQISPAGVSRTSE